MTKLSKTEERVLQEIRETPGIHFGFGRKANTANALDAKRLVEWKDSPSPGWYPIKRKDGER